jgi:hypothetical protein
VIDRRTFLAGAAAVVGGTAVGCTPSRASPAPLPAPGPGDALTDWTQVPSGPVPATDATGRPFLHAQVPPGVRPPVVGGGGEPGLWGGLPDGRSASYVVQDLGRPVSELGLEFAFGTGSALGSFCLARFDRWYEGVTSRGEVRSTLHFGVTPERWTYGVFRSPRLEVVKAQALRTPIPTDGSPRTMRVVVDGTRATVVEPDGTATEIDDPRVAAAPAETFACWEFFKLAPGASDVTFLRTWAR